MRAPFRYTKEKAYVLTFWIFILVLSWLFPALLADDGFDEPAELTVDHILDTHATVQDAPDRVHVELNVLGFVTPWNGAGNKIALSESDKGRLNIVSPVTYQMTGDGLSGGHDYKNDFYMAVNQSGSLIMPRVLFEASFFATASSSSSSSSSSNPHTTARTTAQALIDECHARGFAGFVIEAWQTLHGLSRGSEMSPASYEFMKTVGTTIRSAGFRTALVMPPFTQDIAHMGVTSKQIGDISVGYSYVVVMTYDFSMPSSESPGPLAPLPWVQMAARYFTDICGLREKVLLGLNFYGIDFALGDKTRASNRHIVAHEFVNLLQTQDVQVNWHEAYKEHYFIYEQHSQQENAESEEEGTKQGEKTHVMFYPTRSSIRERVNLARDTNCGGIAIWDIGQGLNHFFEEF